MAIRRSSPGTRRAASTGPNPNPNPNPNPSPIIIDRYAAGGVNWAHQDQSEGPYQAYLLLSRPGVDFTGGGLYITERYS